MLLAEGVEMSIIPFSKILEENGKTIRENNLSKEHKIPLDTQVEVEISDFNDGKSKKVLGFVCRHGRDCDGTPLYDISFKRGLRTSEDFMTRMEQPIIMNLSEESLKIVD